MNLRRTLILPSRKKIAQEIIQNFLFAQPDRRLLLIFGDNEVSHDLVKKTDRLIRKVENELTQNDHVLETWVWIIWIRNTEKIQEELALLNDPHQLLPERNWNNVLALTLDFDEPDPGIDNGTLSTCSISWILKTDESIDDDALKEKLTNLLEITS